MFNHATPQVPNVKIENPPNHIQESSTEINISSVENSPLGISQCNSIATDNTHEQSFVNNVLFNCANNSPFNANSTQPECCTAYDVDRHNSLNIPVLLATAMIIIKTSDNKNVLVRCLIDPGAQISLITARIASYLTLQINPTNLRLVGVASKHSFAIGSANIALSSIYQPLMDLNASVLIVNHIVDQLPANDLPFLLSKQFNQLVLADPEFYLSGPIDCLLGADIYPEIISKAAVSFIHGFPSAQATIFGWIILGKIHETAENTPTRLNVFLTALTPLNQTLLRFWESEEILTPALLKPDDRICENIFITTTTRQADGRYTVRLPMKPDFQPLGSNRHSAYNCFLQLERRMAKQLELHAEYHKFMAEYLELGHMIPAKYSSPYVIPHHCVMKTSSSTTKVRVVFNASAPDHNANNLNNILLAGPKLQKDINNIIIGFRFHAIAICADLKMMYRQILIHDEDRLFQHIFYRPNNTQEVQEYELCTVTYGLAPSAFLAQRTLLQLVEDNGSDFPQASNVVQNHCYVDDVVTGADNFEDAQHLISELNALFALGGFELRKWSSNHPQLLLDLPTSHLENPLIFNDDTSTIKILGLKWNPSNDCFSYQVLPFDSAPTKRNILSYIARTFDPLGFLTPVTFWIKYFIQQLWLAQLDWDTPLTPILVTAWNDFSSQFPTLQDIRIPRFFGQTSQNIRLLGFADASEKGYAACIYVYFVRHNTPQTLLVKAKSRVAPVKTITIPRLELCAALLLAQLYDSILEIFSNFNIEEIRLHSDATVVLAWLKTPPYRLKTYVANRVTQILALTAPSVWYHIRTQENPADLASRGVLPQALSQAELWWYGPPSYKTLPHLWPHNTGLPAIEVPELRNLKTALVTTVTTSPQLNLIERFSSFTRLLRVVSYILRFIHHCKTKSLPHSSVRLTTEELTQSKLVCIRLTQAFHFPQELKILRQDNIPPTIATLTPFIDTLGIIRVGGRIRNANLTQEQAHPILLPKKSHFSNLICDYFHLQTLHSGPRTTQAAITRQYWIVSLRTLLRSRIHRCLTCHRFRARPQQPLMADLPASRVLPSRPFQSVGVDYAGPFTVKLNATRNARTTKGYLCLFVCMSTKAAHLEFVSELSTDAFLASFDRFTARRGLPSDVFSDNGTNFVGAARKLKELHQFITHNQSKIFDNLTSRQINWHFNPPAAPNFGGLWEAAVKSTKLLLHRSIGDKPLNFEEYATLFARIEAVLNSRPIFEFSPDPNEEFTMLTPGHFLIGAPLIQPPVKPHLEDKCPKTRWARLQQILQSFWRLWSQNYLHTQVQRRKWNTRTAPLQVGQVVLMYGVDTHPMNWPLGRIVKLHPGKDGIPRVATVRTHHGIFTRPANKLVTLPHDDVSPQES